MGKLIVTGQKRLEGQLKVQGAKNSVLPILAATILAHGESVIHNVPDLRDVDSAVKILRHLGCKVKREKNTVTVDATQVSCHQIPIHLMREMRSSVIFLGPVLSRCKAAAMSFPGGCELGPRPIDLHIAGLKQLGAWLNDSYGTLEGRVNNFRGSTIHLGFPSVGATENLMLAAAISDGVTVITNCAREPEIEDLEQFLNAMGADIRGGGTATVTIRGVPELHGVEYEVMPDRIAAMTYLTGAAITGGEILLEGVQPAHMQGMTALLKESGCQIFEGERQMALRRSQDIRPIRTIQTLPYPGFPTDAQAILMAYLTLAKGTSVFVENIFESRYKHVGELIRMGADIKVLGRLAIVYGVPRLCCANVRCEDLRGGAALVLAALAAEGTSEIENISHIERGYDHIEDQLTSLGADIKRMS
jgi:UDP-N-acetylglucosamine 1-carboxyvinyltransferase